jgi:hypothetical protein
MNYHYVRIYDILSESLVVEGLQRNIRVGRAIEREAQEEAHGPAGEVDRTKTKERMAKLDKLRDKTVKRHNRIVPLFKGEKRFKKPSDVGPDRSDMLKGRLIRSSDAIGGFEDVKQDVRGGKASWDKPLPKGRSRFDNRR